MYIIISTGDFLLPKQGNGIGSKCSCTAYGLPRLLHGHARGRKDQVPSLCYIFECLYCGQFWSPSCTLKSFKWYMWEMWREGQHITNVLACRQGDLGLLSALWFCRIELHISITEPYTFSGCFIDFCCRFVFLTKSYNL